MSIRSRLLVAGALGIFASLPCSAFVFNVTPGLARAIAPIACGGSFSIKESFRRHSHEYLCDGSDITFLASFLTWLLLASTLSLVVLVLLVALARRRPP